MDYKLDSYFWMGFVSEATLVEFCLEEPAGNVYKSINTSLLL